MKCKLCGKLSGISRVCIVCRTAIYDAALADGYTLADGVVMKRCEDERCHCSWCDCCTNPGTTDFLLRDSLCCAAWKESGHCVKSDCKGTGRVKAGGGGT